MSPSSAALVRSDLLEYVTRWRELLLDGVHHRGGAFYAKRHLPRLQELNRTHQAYREGRHQHADDDKIRDFFLAMTLQLGMATRGVSGVVFRSDTQDLDPARIEPAEDAL